MDGSQIIWIFTGIFVMLASGALPGEPLQNVALNKPAVQSSEHNSRAAVRAVDGMRDPKLNDESCSVTDEESDPWWRVDLQNVYRISAVMITNRYKGENSLDGAEIWFGNSAQIDDAGNIRCAVISHIPKGRTVYFPCRAREGRYVIVRLPGNNKVLSLCEVEVYPADHAYPSPNVALNGDAVQSSMRFSGGASKAIDGRRNSFYSGASCSHTAMDETNPWWRVDLRRTYTVTSVKVTNRGDCCAERLDGAEIRIGNSLENNGNNNPRCASVSHIRAGKTYTFNCKSMEGRYVNVIIPGERKTLTLCEVEVYAFPKVEPLPNVAFKKTATQSSTNANYDAQAANAVNGCSYKFFEGCCTQTHTEDRPWWRVDLSDVHKVTAVTIINRQDCCVDRIRGVEIRIGNAEWDKNSRCGVLPQEQPTPVHTFHCAGLKGRFVDVIIMEDSKILTLCEVEVYASPAAPPKDDPSTSVNEPAPPPPPPPPPTVSMPLSGRTVMVVGERLCWSDALVYCRHHHWDLLSLRSLEEQNAVEKLLSSSPFPLTGHVWLALRRHIMQDGWFWMSGDSMRFTNWRQDIAPHRNSAPCGVMVGGEPHPWEERACGELLNFICQSGPVDAEQRRVYFYSTRL